MNTEQKMKLPSLEDQKKMSDFLDQLTKIKEEAEQMLLETEELQKRQLPAESKKKVDQIPDRYLQNSTACLQPSRVPSSSTETNNQRQNG